MDTPAGWLMPAAAAIREAVHAVVGVGRFTSAGRRRAALDRATSTSSRSAAPSSPTRSGLRRRCSDGATSR